MQINSKMVHLKRYIMENEIILLNPHIYDFKKILLQTQFFGKVYIADPCLGGKLLSSKVTSLVEDDYNTAQQPF